MVFYDCKSVTISHTANKFLLFVTTLLITYNLLFVVTVFKTVVKDAYLKEFHVLV